MKSVIAITHPCEVFCSFTMSAATKLHKTSWCALRQLQQYRTKGRYSPKDKLLIDKTLGI